MPKKFRKDKNHPGGFLIDVAEQCNRREHVSLWGSTEGKVTLKVREGIEFLPKLKKGQTPEEREEQWNLEKSPLGKYTNLPRRWYPDKYLVFTGKVNPEKPRILAMTWSNNTEYKPNGVPVHCRRRLIYDYSYHMDGGSSFMHNVPLRDHMREYVAYMMGDDPDANIPLWHYTMPLLANMVKYDGIEVTKDSFDPLVGRLFRHKRLSDAAVDLFGSGGKRHNQTLQTWMKWRAWEFIHVAAAAKGLVPSNYLDALELGQIFRDWNPARRQQGYDSGVRKLRKFLKLVSVESRKKLITDHKNARGFELLLADIERGIENIERVGESVPELLQGRMPHSWQEFHDILHERARQIQRDKEAAKFKAMKMAQSNAAKNLEDLEFRVPDAPRNVRHLKLVIPKDGTDVVKWGDEMQHCIGSYASQMAKGQCLLFGVYACYEEDGEDHEKLMATGEIRKGQLTQLYGKHNKLMDSGCDNAVRMAIARAVPGLRVSNYDTKIPEFYGPVRYFEEAEEKAEEKAEKAKDALTAEELPF